MWRRVRKSTDLRFSLLIFSWLICQYNLVIPLKMDPRHSKPASSSNLLECMMVKMFSTLLLLCSYLTIIFQSLLALQPIINWTAKPYGSTHPERISNFFLNDTHMLTKAERRLMKEFNHPNSWPDRMFQLQCSSLEAAKNVCKNSQSVRGQIRLPKNLMTVSVSPQLHSSSLSNHQSYHSLSRKTPSGLRMKICVR